MRSSTDHPPRLGTLALAALLALASGGCSGSGPELQVRDQRSDRVYVARPAVDGERVTLAWNHSIELTPWTETYEVRGEDLVLVEVTMESYGAGAPADTEGTTTVRDGVIHITGLERPLDAVRWVHSHDTEHTVSIDGATVVEPADIPHRSFAEIAVNGD